jgi:integrase
MPNNYGNAYQSYQMNAVRNLGIYMRGMGLEAYVVPDELNPKFASRYVARIYTRDELSRIFKAADARVFDGRAPHLHVSLPVFVRLLYCCGLRPSEAIKLRVENIDLEKGEMRILQSKGPKDRLVVMSEDMATLFRKYNDWIESVYPGRTYFFQNPRNQKMFNISWIQKHFTILLEWAGIERDTEPKPRLYDLRHTFASHCIQQWIEQGKDVNAKLLYLCAYLGHKDITNTAYYVHLIPSEFLKQSSLSTRWYEDVTAEVCCEV